MGPQDTIELLAALDFAVGRIREDGGRPHKSEVLEKLVPLLKKRYTSRQIDTRLKSMTRSVDPRTMEDVYRYGSSRINSLDVDLRAKVLVRLESIKSEQVCLLISTPRQLRSVSRNPTTEPSQSTRGSIFVGERRSTRSASRNLATETNRKRQARTHFGEHTPTRSTRQVQQEEPQTRISKLAKKKPLSLKQTLRNPDTGTVARQRFPPRLATTPSCTSIADSGQRATSSQQSVTCMEENLNELANLRSASPSIFYATALQDMPTLDYDGLHAVHQSPDSFILGHSHETLRDLFNDNLYFRKKWLESEEKRKKIDRDGRLRHSLLAPGSTDILQTMADKIETQNERINNLQHQLNNQAFLQPFLTLGKGEELPLNQGQIRTYHAKMRRDFGSLSFMNYFQHPGAKSACIDSQELSELKSKVVADIDQYPISLVIQSLTGAAICEWVFNEKMQCTAMMNTPLLEGYKHHLSTICGETALRNVDLAAHQWVINEELHFQEEFIPRTATKLTERLLSALGPFLKNKNKSDAKLHIRLKSIFCAALNIKSFGMIGKHVFEFIWPAQNSIFDKDCMMEESSEGTTYDRTSLKTEAKKVVLALVPGLRVFKYDRKLVDYSGFMKGDEEGLEQCCIVAQAVVVAH